MNVGLPGLGLGGLFFVLAALAMPLVELARALRGRSSRAGWRVALGQAAMALAMLGAYAATGWLIARLLPARAAEEVLPVAASTGGGGMPYATVTLMVLAALLGVVQVARLLARRPR